MDKPFRRYEMLLPLKFNDGTQVPEATLVDTLLELESRFAAVSCESQTTRGYWQHEGESFRDDLIRVYVDDQDTADNREFFLASKKGLKDASIEVTVS